MTVFRALATAAIAAALVPLAACGADEPAKPVATCESFSLAALDDDSHRAAYYAIENGIVTSEVIKDLDIEYLQIPALIQATGAGQYDMLPTSLPAIQRAREQGKVDLRVAGLIQAQTGGGIKTYVRSDSDLRTGQDLKGRTVGVVGFGSSMMPVSQYLYAEKYGLDSSLQGGDVKFVELDPPTLLNALKKGDVDAAILFHQAGWKASNDQDLRVLIADDEEYHELTNAWPIGGMYVVENDVLEVKRACVTEFQRMIAESVAYAKDNVGSFADEIGDKTGVDPEFIKFWWNGKAYRFGGPNDPEWVEWAEAFYDAAMDSKLMPSRPDLQDLLITDPA